MEDQTLYFEQDKITKGAVRFGEKGDNPVVGSVYVRKSEVPGIEDVKAITVTIKQAG